MTKKKTDETPAEHIARPSRCRIVEYTPYEGDVCPAIVTAVNGDALGLHLFHPPSGGGRLSVTLDVTADARAESGEPNTWNWPPRA